MKTTTRLQTIDTPQIGRSGFSAPADSYRPFFQPKLTIGPVDDVYEREADAVADKVMRMDSPGVYQAKADPVEIQRKCAHCEEEENLQRKEGGKKDETAEVPSSVHEVINSAGKPLDDGTRSFMENRFGYDFGNVKIHTDTVAAKSARSINALAYTSGNSIVFNEGQYSPGSESGKKLLAHELTHVVQQSSDNKRISRQEEDADDDFTTDPDPCEYSGRSDRAREIHLNLRKRAARVYSSRTSYRQFDNLIIGPSTYRLARDNGWCTMYPVIGHQRRSSHGLINFVNYCRGFGFHSNYWHKDGNIEEIPGSQSQGCARLQDSSASDTRSGDSQAFFDLVQDNDCVRLYDRNDWRVPTFKRCNSVDGCV